MNENAPSVAIDIDPLNPAQYFACCGLFELLNARNSDALAYFSFDTRNHHRACFKIDGIEVATISDTLSALKNAAVLADSNFSGGEAPVELNIPGICSIALDWWLSPKRNTKSSFKLWAGQQTTLKLVQDMLSADWGEIDTTVFQYRLPMTGRFGVDPRSSWNTLDFGSSPDAQNVKVYSYPAVELLAAIGLQGFRPCHMGGRKFCYFLWSAPLPVAVARAAICGALINKEDYAFAFKVEKRSGSYSYFTFSQNIEEGNYEK